jgi:5'-methylthioadenosine phosphorylase
MTTPSQGPDPTTEAAPRAEIGVIGGSGFYTFLDDAHEVAVETPFGPPSDPPVVGSVGGRTVAFVPRHGRDHRHAPHRLNYRANLWALRSLGVRQVLAPCAVGSMQPDWGPGTLVVPDQVIDRTWAREHTIYTGDGPVVHVPFADPYCSRGREAVIATAAGQSWTVQPSGTLVVINGPRFSSRAESRWHASAGGDIVGMTGMPEAAIARELALCYTTIAVVTDLDAGFEHGAGVTMTDVLAVFARSVERLKTLVGAAVAALPGDDCACRHVLDGLTLPFALP